MFEIPMVSKKYSVKKPFNLIAIKSLPQLVLRISEVTLDILKIALN